MNRLTTFLLLFAVLSCKKSDPQSYQKALLSFSFAKATNPTLATDAAGMISGQQVTLILPAGTKADALKATFSTSPLSSVSVDGVRQESGVTSHDFTRPITYRVTAEDGSTTEYTVTATVAKSGEKTLVAFSFLKATNPDLPADFPLTINGNQLTATLPAGLKSTALKASFTVSPAATVTVGGVKQESGVTTNDFMNPLTYRVTAEDGSTIDYTVTVGIAKSSEKQITSFSFAALNPVVQATIDQTSQTITATVPADANLNALVPTITLSAKATISPTSGSPQNFTNPVSYTVTAEDGSTQTYQVKIEKRLVTAVPTALGLNEFYKKYVDASGIPVVSSNKVPDAALIQARAIINQMLEKSP